MAPNTTNPENMRRHKSLRPRVAGMPTRRIVFKDQSDSFRNLQYFHLFGKGLSFGCALSRMGETLETRAFVKWNQFADALNTVDETALQRQCPSVSSNILLFAAPFQPTRFGWSVETIQFACFRPGSTGRPKAQNADQVSAKDQKRTCCRQGIRFFRVHRSLASRRQVTGQPTKSAATHLRPSSIAKKAKRGGSGQP